MLVNASINSIYACLMSEEEQNQKLAIRNDLQEASLLKVQVKDKEIVPSMVDGKVYATDNACTQR